MYKTFIPGGEMIFARKGMLAYTGISFITIIAAVNSAAVIIDPSNPTVQYAVSKDTYLDKSDKNTNHGSDIQLQLSSGINNKTAVLEAPVSLQVDIAHRVLFDPLDPNFETRFETGCDDLLRSAELAEIVIEVTSAQCPVNGCLFEVRPLLDEFEEASATYNCADDTNLGNNDPDCSPKWNGGHVGEKTITVEVADGFMGEIELDVTADVQAGVKKWHLEVKRDFSSLTLASRESGTPPRVDVKFPDPVIPDTLAPYRQFVSVPAPSVSGPIGGPAYDGDVDINYALVGDVDADVIFWFWHGVPNNSYMWRAVISGLESRLSNTSESVAFLAHDFFGHGLSERINSVDCNVGFGAPPGLLHCDEPNYKPARHFEIMEAFSNALGLGDNGQKVVIVTHDWGGMTGLHWAGTHLDKLGGVATMESWMISCPDSEAYPNDGNQDGVSCFNNSPLSQSPGYEQFVRNAQRPYSDFQTFALSLEALFLEQEQNGFDIWIKDPFGLFGGSGMQQALSLGTIPQPIIDHYQSAFPAVNPPGESLRASFVQAPRSIPYPIPLAPQAPQDYNFPNGVGGLYDVGVQTMDTYIFNYTNNLRYNFSGPMMLMVAEPGTLYSVPGMIQAAEQNYQNQTAVCIGNESHMIPETTPFFVAQRLAEWALAEGILTSSKN